MANFSNIRVVLVRPIYGGNVGSVCRAMANTCLSDLALVAPGPLDENEARKMACNAQEILAGRKVFAGIDEALADRGMVVGTTARLGLYRSHSHTPREWAPAIARESEVGKVALVFGPEDNGLTNEDLAKCTHLIQIPSNPGHPSLNLAQAVMVCCYEVYVASGTFEPSAEKSPEAGAALRERMLAMWEHALLDIGFMQPDTALHMMLGVRRILSRDRLTENDVRILMGIARQTQWCADELARRGGSARRPRRADPERA